MLSLLFGWLSRFSLRIPNFRVLVESWIICAALIAATCLVGWCYKGFLQNHSRDKPRSTPTSSQSIPASNIPPTFRLSDIFARLRRRRPPPAIAAFGGTAPLPRAMRFQPQVRLSKKPIPQAVSLLQSLKTKQPFEVFLVLDVEATCQRGTDFNFPNEIIEFPVCLMRWKDRSDDQAASQLEVAAEFRSFVKPTWRPILSQFCTDLTGITQEQVDSAPLFPAVIKSFEAFMIKHGLLDPKTGERLVRFCWCSDGPFDVRDFVVKQCFISKVPMPSWLQGDVLDVRTIVMDWLQPETATATYLPGTGTWGPRRRSLNISGQLNALGLPAFEGRQHSGIDVSARFAYITPKLSLMLSEIGINQDSRNIAKILAELGRRGVCLCPNTIIYPNRRWHWMGKRGQILEEQIFM